MEGCEFLNDRYLFERPAAQVLEEAYEDVKREEIQLEVRLPLSGVQQFLAENFGLLLKRRRMLEQLEQGESRRFGLTIIRGWSRESFIQSAFVHWQNARGGTGLELLTSCAIIQSGL